MDTRKVPDHILNSTIRGINSFFLNDPFIKWEKVLWEFYTSTVYNGKQILTGEENADILFQYECLKKFLHDLNQLNEKMKQYDQ